MVRWTSALTVCALLFGACGGDSGESSGVDGDKQLSELSSEEVRKLCAWQNELDEQDQSSITTERICTADASYQTADKAQCESARDECIEQAQNGEGPQYLAPRDCNNLNPSDLSEECGDVLVADVEKCARVVHDAIIDSVQQASCDPAERPREGDSNSGQADACDNVSPSCLWPF